MSAGAQWASAGLTEVLLPSGFRVRGVIPSPTDIVRRQIVPSALRVAVNGIAGQKLASLDDAQLADVFESRARQASAFVREIWSDELQAWESFRLPYEEFDTLDPRDREALDDLIGRNRTADAITLESEVILGLRTPEEAAQTREGRAEEEAASTVDGWAGFRDESGSVDVGAPGGDVEPTSLESARAARADDCVPPRRRASSKAPSRARASAG